MYPDKIYYEPAALDYELGRQLREKFGQEKLPLNFWV